MARHGAAAGRPAGDVAPAVRRIRATGHLGRLAALAVVWLAGLGVGAFALFAIAARIGCAKAARGLVCTNVGTGVGALVVLAVIVAVTAVSVVAHDGQRALRSALVVAVGLVVLAGCLVGADALLRTA